MYTVRLSVRLGRNRDSEGPAPPRLADNRALSRLIWRQARSLGMTPEPHRTECSAFRVARPVWKIFR